MKTRLKSGRRPSAGYALMIVLGVTAVTLVVLAATMTRTGTVANLNDRNNQYVANLNAAEAATEKVYALMAFDFARAGGPGQVADRLDFYRTNVPNASENPYWSNYEFSDGQGQINRTYVQLLTTNFTGALPSQYPGLAAIRSPVYRIISNVRAKNGRVIMTNAVQEDVLLALVPITTYAIFYNSLLEFSTCADMTINGRVHANGAIYTGTSATLTFNGTVTTTSTLQSPYNNGSGPWTFPGGIFKGSPTYKTNVPTVTIAINMTNTHSLIEMPPSDELVSSKEGQQRLYNQAQVLLLVSNTTFYASNTTITIKIQASPDAEHIPAADSNPYVTNYTLASATTNLPFLSVSNVFYDQRENKTNITSQIDLGKYASWISTNPVIVASNGKFPSSSGTYPTILYVADKRKITSGQLNVVRLTNGIALPKNGGRGFSVATPNPLYVWGNYNCTNSSYLEKTNTSATVPAALMSDALTILSSKWDDPTSFFNDDSGPTPSSAITVNAAILTGIVPSTTNTQAGFSGGVHNLPRLLEDWTSSRHVWLNTSIINLYRSTMATNKFITPGAGSYYTAPTRHFSFDVNFLDPNKQPPGVPCALVPIRYNWAVPPANTTTYNVTP